MQDKYNFDGYKNVNLLLHFEYMKYKLNFTAWYLNVDRIYQLINSKELINHMSTLEGVQGSCYLGSPEGLARSVIKQSLEDWLHVNEIPSLGELIVQGKKLEKGQLFTIFQDFYGKGLSLFSDSMKTIPRDAVAEIHNKLKLKENIKIRIQYSPSNLINATAWNRMSGHTKLFCFCYIDDYKNNEIIARPYLIGDIHTGLKLNTPNNWSGQNYGEIHPTLIDQFSKIIDVYENEIRPPRISLMKNILEEDVKNALAEIINEGNIPKDWGGEKSDLFSTNLSVNGRYMSSAFLLKGPARFSPMKMIHLGKNGDQIDRLFSEPADLLILQHCHKVDNAVRSAMKAYASRIHKLRYFTHYRWI